MKHGIVRSGGYTTYYGNDAMRFLARRSVEYTSSKKEASRKIRDAGSVEFRNVLVEELRLLGYTFSEAHIRRLNRKTEAEDRKRAEERLAQQKGQIRKLPRETQPTSSKCSLCKRRISKGAEYYDGGKGNRAHVSCAAE